MTLKGKGFFIWQIRNCERGDVNAIASLAVDAKLTHVLVKIADVTVSYNIIDGVDLVPPLAKALWDRKIQCWGWHYVKGDNPIGEADKAIERLQTLHLDGYVIDAEIEYQDSGKATAATKFMNRLRSALPDIPVALSSYRYPAYHPQIPWKEFLDKCDLNMPQVYWLQAHNPADQLKRSVQEFQNLEPHRPVIPIGAAYKEYGWAPTSSDVFEFMQTAQDLNLTAANFYSWDSCRANLPDVWNTIRAYEWDAQPPPQDITGQYIAALNTHNPDQVVDLYTPTAVHVTAARTIQGHAAIRAWYQTMFSQLLPNGVFTLSGFTGTDNSRHFTWTATSSQGKVNNGSDTFGLSGGKIIYHYSFFTVTA
jgi:hypothetical protein